MNASPFGGTRAVSTALLILAATVGLSATGGVALTLEPSGEYHRPTVGGAIFVQSVNAPALSRLRIRIGSFVQDKVSTEELVRGFWFELPDNFKTGTIFFSLVSDSGHTLAIRTVSVVFANDQQQWLTREMIGALGALFIASLSFAGKGAVDSVRRWRTAQNRISLEAMDIITEMKRAARSKSTPTAPKPFTHSELLELPSRTRQMVRIFGKKLEDANGNCPKQPDDADWQKWQKQIDDLEKEAVSGEPWRIRLFGKQPR